MLRWWNKPTWLQLIWAVEVPMITTQLWLILLLESCRWRSLQIRANDTMRSTTLLCKILELRRTYFFFPNDKEKVAHSKPAKPIIQQVHEQYVCVTFWSSATWEQRCVRDVHLATLLGRCQLWHFEWWMWCHRTRYIYEQEHVLYSIYRGGMSHDRFCVWNVWFWQCMCLWG